MGPTLHAEPRGLEPATGAGLSASGGERSAPPGRPRLSIEVHFFINYMKLIEEAEQPEGNRSPVAVFNIISGYIGVFKVSDMLPAFVFSSDFDGIFSVDQEIALLRVAELVRGTNLIEEKGFPHRSFFACFDFSRQEIHEITVFKKELIRLFQGSDTPGLCEDSLENIGRVLSL